MNKRHTFGALLAILMLPALLCGAIWHLVPLYFRKGVIVTEDACEELDSWMENNNGR